MSTLFVVVLGMLPAAMLWAVSYLVFRDSWIMRIVFCLGIFAALTIWFWPVSLLFSPIGFVGLVATIVAFEWAVEKDRK